MTQYQSISGARSKRTKYLVGVAIFSSQLVISNLKSNTIFSRIDKIETKEECNGVYEELIALFKKNKEAISSEQAIKICKMFFKKAKPFSRSSWGSSVARLILKDYSNFINQLQGWKKVKMQMEYIEVINAATTHDRAFVDGKYFTEGLEGRERVEFDSWMEKTGRPIQIRWSIMGNGEKRT